MAKKLLTDIQRFSRATSISDAGCWEWTLFIDKDGYGLFKIGSYRERTQKQVRAHRWAYENFVGPIPDGMQIDHICCNPSCVNPEHLQPVTPLRNTQLGWERGTHLPHFTPHSDATRAKIRAKAIGRKASAETRARMSASHRERYLRQQA